MVANQYMKHYLGYYSMWYLYVLYAILGILLFIIAPLIIVQWIVAKFLFKKYFTRSEQENWTRVPKVGDSEEEKMYEIGEGFHKENINYKEDVEIDSGEYHLAGEFYNFGFNKTVIIVPGRSESLTYAYFFAMPYKDCGYNVLAIDNRGHGYSTGKINSLGLDEYKDILNWCRFLHDEKHQDSIIGHGICIGSATILYAIIHNKEEDLGVDYLDGVIADGMYVNFVESFKNHGIEKGYEKGLVPKMFFNIMKRKAHVDPYFGPIDCIDKLEKPILFLYGKEDIYSVPEMSQILYDKCSAPKKIVWFDKGAHSRLKINAMEKYDNEIKDWLNNINSLKEKQ